MLLNKKFNNNIFMLLIVAIFILFISISTINSVYAVEKTISSSDNLKTTVENSLSESSVATINLKPGTYDMSGKTITINGNVTINGLATGSSRPILDAENKDRIFIVNHGSTLTLKNLVLTNGRRTETQPLSQWGGAIYSKGGNLIIENCVFSKNTVTTQYYPSGGAIACEGGTLSIKSSTFTQNKVGGVGGADWGGAIYCRGSTLFIEGSTFTENKAGSGGAIDCLNTNVSIMKSYFNKNQASEGGAIDFSYTSSIARYENAMGNNKLVITDSHFTENKATHTKYTLGSGGAISSSSGVVTINNCIFTKNTAKLSRGAIESYYDKISIVSSTFKENSASTAGAINSYSSSLGVTSYLNINKCIFTKNIAKANNKNNNLGGGAICSSGLVNIFDSVFTKNKANGNKIGRSERFGGGAIRHWGTLNVDKSNFSGNAAKTNGGAISFYKGNGTITRSSFSKNTASINGSVINCDKYGGISKDITKGALIVSKNVFSGNKGKYILYRDKTFKKKLNANNNYWGKNMTLKKVKSSCYGVNISNIAKSPNIRK